MQFRTMALACMAALALTSLNVSAQAPEQQIPVYRLDLRQVEDIPTGTAALVAGNAGEKPDRFFLDNLYMLKPVSVTVRAVNPGDVVNVKLTKEKWEDVLREGSTGAESQVNFKFRTQGQFQVSITSPTPGTPYKMVVWVGPDVLPKSKPIFVPLSQFKEGGTAQWIWWAGGGAILLIGALVAFMRKRKTA